MATKTSNLFKKSLSNAPVKKSEKKKIEVVDSTLFSTMEEIAEKNEEIDNLNAQLKVLTSELKDRAIEVFSEDYVKNQDASSFILQAKDKSGKTASMMFIPTDRYITIDEERSKQLAEEFGEDVIEEKPTYTIDPEMVEKYGEIISELILNSKKIAEEDKEKIITGTVKYTVRKGTIDKMKNYLKKFTAPNVKSFIDEIKPVFMIKNVHLDK
jgi:hypothetical protein